MGANTSEQNANEELQPEQVAAQQVAAQLTELQEEYSTLIKKNGLKKATIILRSFNSGKEEVKAIDTYEYIIGAVMQVYGVTEEQLYMGGGKFIAIDPRRTAYILLRKYLNYTQANIAVQFGKSREAINWSMIEFKKLIKDDFYKNTFIKKHEEVERLVETYINNKKPSPEVSKDSDKTPPANNKSKKNKA